MSKSVNILQGLKILLMALSVVFMLTACNSDETSNTEQGPLATEDSQNQQRDATAIAEENTQCWQTGVISVLYKEMGKVALETYRKMTSGALTLMMVAFAIWMSIRLLKQIGSFKEENTGEVWTEIAKMFFLCFVCGLVASDERLLTFVLGDLIFPIYNAFLEFASAILNDAVKDSGNMTITAFKGSGVLESAMKIENPVCKAGALQALDATGNSFPESPEKMMGCMVCSLNSSLSFGIKAAYAIMQQPGVTGWIVGLFVLICFLFVKLGFVFYLIDTIFRFTIMVVMLPLMIMGYPFKSTRGLLSQGIANMCNSAGFMMFFAVIISMCVLALSNIVQQMNFGPNASFASFSIPFVCMMMIGFLVISSIKVAGKLCDRIVGGSSNSEFQKSAKALIVGALKMVTSGGSALVKLAMPKTVEKFANFKNKVSGRVHQITGK